ncbi:MAG: hypothetical protein AAB573_03150, partial [Patescibacteria group bacterium]
VSENVEPIEPELAELTPMVEVAPLQSVDELLASVMTPPVSTTNTEPITAGTTDQNAVSNLATAILSGDRESAYVLVRNLETTGMTAPTVLTILASTIDQLVRARRAGSEHLLNTASVGVSNEALHRIVEVLMHALDNHYQNPYTGVKLAVAQSFEARG